MLEINHWHFYYMQKLKFYNIEKNQIVLSTTAAINYIGLLNLN